MKSSNSSTQKVSKANENQTSQGLIIQNYSNSILEQGEVNFSEDEKLKTYQSQINNSIRLAKAHATRYINVIQPSIIQNISNIGNYYNLHQVIATQLPENATKEEWLEVLGALKQEAINYEKTSRSTVILIQDLHSNLAVDSSSFSTTVDNLNNVLNGDKGVLSTLKNELGSIQGKISGAIAGMAVSGFVIMGGVFIILIGSVADFITAGTSLPIVFGGVAMLVSGVSGEVGSAITFATLNNAKNKLISEEVQLADEVKLSLLMSTAYEEYVTQLHAAMTASTTMANAWQFLISDIEQYENDLSSGIMSPADFLRTMFLGLANEEAKAILKDINNIKKQMTGVRTVVAKPGQTISQLVESEAK
ncbi:HBL/NHE enterotoxin family protein [Photobacterium profundum]|uniref:HBL/NHE enterotoxin family protein n=1 Tax=Photobacterium profundum (strain SS9) TaxID=298386 RepID=Q6LH90_PHOPR|nr:HBL/NHE enterotoxin family protein [Photobacterium profundum]CAG23340.1 hypothetical protein PBPRB1474 [Photobacterium profundum SS9]